MSTGSPLPPNWRELLPVPSDVSEIGSALDLVRATLPNRYYYENLDLPKILRKMVPRRNHNGDFVSGMRIFRRVDPNTNAMDIAAFFFVRLYHTNSTDWRECYTMTVGVTDTGVTGAQLYDAVRAICQVVAGEPGGERIEVVNEFDLPSDLPDLPATNIVKEAFNLALPSSTTSGPGQFDIPPVDVNPPSPPWPGQLKCWLFNP